MKNITILLTTIILMTAHAWAQSTEGKEFFVAFLFNYNYSYDQLSLVVTGQRSCTGTVTNPNTGWSKTFTVNAQQITKVEIPNSQAYTASFGTNNYGLFVTTTDTVSLYAANYFEASYDVTFVLPTDALRNEYIVQNYTNHISSRSGFSGFVVVAAQDNTVIDITPSVTPDERTNASPYSITLNRGQTYQTGTYNTYNGQNTMTGTRIVARDCKPIAVFAGNSIANIPSGVSYADHIYEQMMPVSSWGQRFVVTATAGRYEDRVRITSSDNGCAIYINGAYSATLAAGETKEYTISSPTEANYVETSKPVQVYLYIPSYANDYSNLGDPSMVLISPIEQQMRKVTFGTFNTSLSSTHYVNVTTLTDEVPNMRLDGSNISRYFNTVSGNPAYSFARLSVAGGSHTIESVGDAGFVAHVYGLGRAESYCYAVGSSTRDQNTKIVVNDGLSISPSTCAGDTVVFKMLSDHSFTSVQWLFGDGQRGSGDSTSHVYTSGGTFTVKAIADFDLNDCSLATMDTLTTTIRVISAGVSVVDTATCDGQPIVWNGQTYRSSISQTSHFTTPDGCDSIAILNLMVSQNSSTTAHETIYSNQLPHVFNGLTFNRAADTTLHFTNTAGCDSAIHYTLTVYPYIVLDTSVCENSLPLTWRGLPFSGSGTQTTTLNDNTRLALTLHVLYNSSYEQHDTVVENQLPIHFAGATFQGSQADTLLVRANAAGCDSLIAYSLHVWPNIHVSLDTTICENALPLAWHDMTFSDEGNQQKRLAGQHGEDSIVSLTLHVNRNSRHTRRDTVVQNATPVLFAGLSFSHSQNDTVIIRANAAGCDSLITYSLHVWPNLNSEADTILCEGLFPFTWNGITFDSPTETTANAKLTGMHGEDSTVTMHVMPLFNSRFQQHDTIVENALPTSFAGLTFRHAQRDTLIVRANAIGCDSLITYSLYVHLNKTTHFDTAVCPHVLPIEWRNETFANADSIVNRLAAASGADSTVTLRLSLFSAYDTTLYARICSELPIYIGSQPFNTNGLHEATLRTVNGCDSVVHLHLETYDYLYYDRFDTTCSNRLLVFEDERIGQTGTYEHIHANPAGCDTIVRMNVVVYPSYRDTDHVALCHGEEYLWSDGKTYTATTQGLTQRHKTQLGCDSLRILDLTFEKQITAAIKPPAFAVERGRQLIFTDVSPFDGQRQWFMDDQYLGGGRELLLTYPDPYDSVNIILVISNQYGCSSSDTLTIYRDHPDVWAPNVFTPSEPTNNTFRVAAKNLHSFNCHIYNRQGLFVFSSSSLDDQWDGTHNGQPCPTGSYVYHIRYSSIFHPDKYQTFSGSVLLLR